MPMTALSVNQEKICIKLKTIWKWTSWFYTNDFMKIIQYQTLISITTLRLVIMTLPTKQFWIIMKSQKNRFGILLDSKLNIDFHITSFWKQADQKLRALARINHYLTPDQKILLLSSVLKSLLLPTDLDVYFLIFH